MRKITLFTTLFIASLGFSQPFLDHLGSRGNQNIECFCTDSKGNLTIGYYPSNTIENLVFEKWDVIMKKWILVGKLKSTKQHYPPNYSKCIYTNNDSLIVFTSYNESGVARNGLFYVTPTNSSKLSEFRAAKERNVVMTDLKIMKGKLVAIGRYDTIISSNFKRYDHTNVSYYNGIEWLPTGLPIQYKLYDISYISVANNNEEAMVLFNVPGYELIARYMFPSQWEIIRKLPRKEYFPLSSVTFVGNRWMFTRAFTDTIYYFDGKTFSYKLIDKKFTSRVSVINTSKGVFLSEDQAAQGPSSIFRIDTAAGKALLIYQSTPPESDSANSFLINSKQNIYYRSDIPILFKDNKIGKVARINLDSVAIIKFKTIVAHVFYDKNNNYKLDNGEIGVPAVLRNRTYHKLISSTTGVFEEKIPDFNEAEYELVSHSYSECLALPFTGALKTNILRGGTNDPLYFPLQKTSSIKNVDVKSWGRPTARLLDTILLSVKITNGNCDLNDAEAIVTINLDSGTQLVSSVPGYSSSKGNTLTYNLKNITIAKGSIINLKVIYSNAKYKINDYVKHHVNITSPYPEDIKNNKDSIIQKMVYSYDPNAKYSIPQGTIISDLTSIRYYIEFQNEGNDDARRVTVVDTLDARIPVYEFQMVASSHAYTVALKNNIVTWVFDNINLPAKSLDEKGSQGYVIFDAHVVANIGIGDSIRNKAYIYFDYNSPIITNLSIIKRIEDLPKVDETDNTFRIFPNPAFTTVTIENKINDYQNIKVFNMVGQEVQNIQLNPIGKTIQSVSSWPKGMYFIRSTKGNFQKFLVH